VPSYTRRALAPSSRRRVAVSSGASLIARGRPVADRRPREAAPARGPWRVVVVVVVVVVAATATRAARSIAASIAASIAE